MDNLNTHSLDSFYETFESEEARRLINRFEFHYTLKHGGWLNIAEIELGVLIRQYPHRTEILFISYSYSTLKQPHKRESNDIKHIFDNRDEAASTSTS
jgi:hypothetical protein